MGEPEEIIVGADYAEAAVDPTQNESIEKVDLIAWWIVFSRLSRGGRRRAERQIKEQKSNRKMTNENAKSSWFVVH